MVGGFKNLNHLANQFVCQSCARDTPYHEKRQSSKPPLLQAHRVLVQGGADAFAEEEKTFSVFSFFFDQLFFCLRE